MPVYFLNAGADAEQANVVEQQVRRAIPELISLASLEDVVRNGEAKGPGRNDVAFIVGDRSNLQFDKLLDLIFRYRDRLFFVLVSDDIPINDYKKLLRTESAEWISTRADPQEIANVLAKGRSGRREDRKVRSSDVAAVAISIVPSAGGVGNTTLAAEVAVYLKKNKATKNRRICVVDLDFQSSHVCDYLDIEPRLQIREISENPDCLDAQLFEIFISRHSTDLHVFAAPRTKFDPSDLDLAALDTFLSMASMRYDLILLDLPVTWFRWTRQIISASDGVMVTGLNTVPGLRRMVETLAAIRDSTPCPDHVAVAVNRCRQSLFGGIARGKHVKSALAGERIFYVGEEPMALESVNTGEPMALAGSYRAIGKDIAKLAAFCAELKSTRTDRVPA